MKLHGLSPPGSRLLHDGIAFAADSARVERDSNGVPIAWELLQTGSNELVKNGEAGSLELDADDMTEIIGYFRRKGEKIPLDSNHYLHHLATLKKLDEGELARLLPSGVAAMGYGSLALRGDDLWVQEVEWNPTAYELMKEGIFRYFSPALRGLKKAPLRLTSIALENEPSINHLDSLAAAADDDEVEESKPKQGASMKHLSRAIARLLGRDSIALEADGDSADVAEAVEEKAKFLDSIRKELKLDAGVSDAAVAAAIKGAIEKAGGYDELKKELDEIKEDQEEAKRDALIEEGLAEGKLTEESAEKWAKEQDSEALAAYLKHAPKVVPVGKLPRGKLPEDKGGDEVALTADDRRAIEHYGFDENKYKEQLKKGTK